MFALKYKIWQWGGPVGAGAMESSFMAMAAVAKRANDGMPYAVASELVCANLARVLRLPVPPSLIVEHDGAPYHVSLDFNLAGQALPPADGGALVAAHPHLAAGIVCFDAWIINPDRHNGNLAFDKSTGRVSLFDHSHAFLHGQDPKAWLMQQEPTLGIGGHCLASKLNDGRPTKEWVNRIKQVPEYFVRDLLRDAVEVGLTPDVADWAGEFLLARRDKLPALLAASAAAFPNVPVEHLANN